MKPEEQRIAIAEWCGWKRVEAFGGEVCWFGIWDEGNPNPTKTALLGTLPDYLNDLNAMHEAEKFMEENRPTLCFKYSNNLRMVINPGGPVGDFRLIHATAEQRAEAILKTIRTNSTLHTKG